MEIDSILDNKISSWEQKLNTYQSNNTVFKEIPVPLDDFLYSKSFLNITKLSPIQYEFIKYGTQIYNDSELEQLKWDKIRRVGELVAYWGKSSGKDMCSIIIQVRIAYLLLCLNNPQSYFNLHHTSSIDMLNMAYNSDQAEGVFFETFAETLRQCSWFSDKCKIGTRVIEFDKRIYAYSGHSFEEAFEGKNLIVAVLDEISAFKTKVEVEQMSLRRLRAPRYSAESVFDMAKSSVESRFSNGIGKVISLSFSRFKNDYIEQLYEAGKNEATCYVSKGATWEVNPNKKKEDFADEFRKNPERAEARYACNPSSIEGGYFKNKIDINQAFPILSEDLIPSTSDIFPSLKDWFKCKHNFICSIHIDLGLKKDKAGICVAHISNVINSYIQDELGEKTHIQLPVVEVDLLTSFIAPYNGEIDFSLIRQMIVELVNKGFKIGKLTCDQFGSIDFLQIVSKMGIETDTRSVDRNTDAYDCLKELIYDGRLKGYSYIRTIDNGSGNLLQTNEIIDELSHLVFTGRKIDHSAYSCFTGDTKVSLVDGRELTFLEMIEEQKQGKDLWVYSLNLENGKIVPVVAQNIRKTGENVTELLEVTLDNDEKIRCTLEHLFMLRDGAYKKAKDLKENDSLMPLYRKVCDKGMTGYRILYQPFTNKWHFEHKEFCGKGAIVKRGNIRHHTDFNKLNNIPTNLKIMSIAEHKTLHNNSTLDYSKISEKIKSWHERMKGTEIYKQRNVNMIKTRKENDSKRTRISKMQTKVSTIGRLIKLLRKRIINLGGTEYLETVRISKMVVKLKENHKLGKFKKAYEKLQEYNLSEEGKKQHSIIMKKVSQLPRKPVSEERKCLYRKNRIAYNKSEERIKMMHEKGYFIKAGKSAMKKFWNSLENRKKHSIRMKKQNRLLTLAGNHNLQKVTQTVYLEKVCDICQKTLCNITHQKWAGHRKSCKSNVKFLNFSSMKNHKIKSIVKVTSCEDVYDLEVPLFHNFALSAGIFVHNSKDLADALSGSVQGAIELGYSSFDTNDIMEGGERESALVGGYETEYLERVSDTYFN